MNNTTMTNAQLYAAVYTQDTSENAEHYTTLEMFQTILEELYGIKCSVKEIYIRLEDCIKEGFIEVWRSYADDATVTPYYQFTMDWDELSNEDKQALVPNDFTEIW